MKIPLLVATIATFAGMSLASLFGQNPQPVESQFAPLLVQAPTHEYHQRVIVTPERIYIPKTNLDLQLKSAASQAGSYEFFPDAASYLATSAKPGEWGNAVIYAHNTEDFFGPLEKVFLGDRVFIEGEGKTKSYLVYAIRVVSPAEVGVIAQTADERLTLLTCTGAQKSQRLIIIAKPASSFAALL